MKLSLEKSTIGDFHRNLMEYYSLVKEKQKAHTGAWGYHEGKLNPVANDGKDLNVQDRTIMRDRDWGSKTEWRDTMMKAGYNKQNTRLGMVEMDKLPKNLLDELSIRFKMKLPLFTMNIQPPGSVVPAHEDTWYKWCDKYPDEMENYTFEDTMFLIVFLTEQETGHFFQMGNQSVHWKPGDIFSMPYYTNHATGNAGFNNKILVQCLGISDARYKSNQ